jgi:hypothetical protein
VDWHNAAPRASALTVIVGIDQIIGCQDEDSEVEAWKRTDRPFNKNVPQWKNPSFQRVISAS